MSARVRSERLGPLDAAAWVVPVVIGLILFFVRRAIVGTGFQVPALLEIYAVLAAMSVAVPLPDDRNRILPVPVVLAAGIAAFVAVTLVTHPVARLPHGPEVLALNTVAAFSEEAFFRRLVYGVVAPRGVMLAVVGSAVLFAAVHVPFYGSAVFWVDLGAGLVLGWQRWASGSWVTSGATHALANALAVLR